MAKTEQHEMNDLREKEQAKKSPFPKFVQLNKTNLKYLINLTNEKPQAMKILLFMIENMDGYNALMASYKVFQERFNMSKATVTRHIRFLKDNGYIYIYKSGTSNVYVINYNLVWQSYGKNIEHCKFPANIILTMSEQDEKTCLSINREKITVVNGKAVNGETGEILENIPADAPRPDQSRKEE